MSNRLEELEVYTLADSFSNDIWDIVIRRDFFAKDTIGNNLLDRQIP